MPKAPPRNVPSNNAYDRSGRMLRIEIEKEEGRDPKKYRPNGIKWRMRIVREKVPGGGDFEIIFLIDNHDDFGFHSHPNLPEDHDVREIIPTDNWEDAWNIFSNEVARVKKL